MTGLIDLPDEVLVLIFQQLKPYDFSRLQRISKRIDGFVRAHQKALWRGQVLSLDESWQDGETAFVSEDRMLERAQVLQKRFQQDGIEGICVFLQPEKDSDFVKLKETMDILPTLRPRHAEICFTRSDRVHLLEECLYNLLAADSLRSLVLEHLSMHSSWAAELSGPFRRLKPIDAASRDGLTSPSPLTRLSLTDVELYYILLHPRLQCGLPKLTKLELTGVRYTELYTADSVHRFLHSVKDTLEDLTMSVSNFDYYDDFNQQDPYFLNDVGRLNRPITFPRLQRLSLEFVRRYIPFEQIRTLRLLCPNLRFLTFGNVHPLNLSDLLGAGIETLHLRIVTHTWSREAIDEVTKHFARCGRLRRIVLDEQKRDTKQMISSAFLEALVKHDRVPVDEIRLQYADPKAIQELVKVVQSRLASTAFGSRRIKTVSIEVLPDDLTGIVQDLEWLKRHVVLYREPV